MKLQKLVLLLCFGISISIYSAEKETKLQCPAEPVWGTQSYLTVLPRELRELLARFYRSTKSAARPFIAVQSHFKGESDRDDGMFLKTYNISQQRHDRAIFMGDGDTMVHYVWNDSPVPWNMQRILHRIVKYGLFHGPWPMQYPFFMQDFYIPNQVDRILHDQNSNSLVTRGIEPGHYHTHILDLKSEKNVYVSNATEGYFCEMALSKNGDRIAYLRLGDGVLFVYNKTSQDPDVTACIADGSYVPLRIVFNVEGDQLYAVMDKVIHVYCSNTGKHLQEIKGHSDHISSLKRKGNKVLTSSWDGTARIWDTKDWKPLKLLQHQVSNTRDPVNIPLNDVSCDESVERVATLTDDSMIYLWHALSATLLYRFQVCPYDVQSIEMNNKGTHFLLQRRNGISLVSFTNHRMEEYLNGDNLEAEIWAQSIYALSQMWEVKKNDQRYREYRALKNNPRFESLPERLKILAHDFTVKAHPPIDMSYWSMNERERIRNYDYRNNQ